MFCLKWPRHSGCMSVLQRLLMLISARRNTGLSLEAVIPYIAAIEPQYIACD